MPRLPLVDCNESIIYAFFCNKLQKNLDLGRVVRQFGFWMDSKLAPTATTLPYLELAIADGGTEPQTYDKTTAFLVLPIHILIDGTDARDILNLWNCTRNALYPGDGSVLTFLQANGATNVRLISSGYGTDDIEGNKVLRANGAIEVAMFVGVSQ